MTMTTLDDVRTMIQAAVGNLTPAKAQELAKDLEPNAAKEQVAKTAADILEWSQRNRERIMEFLRKEIREQLHQVGAATQDDLDAVKKRVRELERAAGMTASGRKAAAKKPAAKKPATRKAAAKKPADTKPADTKPATAPTG
jgi:hypothetical protein